jgi:hypothetical protein
MTTLRLMVLVAALALTACGSSSDPLFINPDYQLTVSDDEYRKRLQDWFNCDECVNGQLRRLQELGDFAVDDLAAAMGGTMIQVGGTDIELADDTAIVTARCTRFTTGLPAGFTPAVTTADCVSRFEANRDRRFRARAREALIAIRTDKACGALGRNVCLDIEAFFPPAYGTESDRSIRRIAVP